MIRFISILVVILFALLPSDAAPPSTMVVYDFSAQWCAPCRRFGPIFDGWRKKHTKTNITFVTIDVDHDKEKVANKFKIRAIPTILIAVDTREVKRFVGAPNEQDILPYLK